MRFLLFFSLALSVFRIAHAAGKDIPNLELEVKQNGKIPVYFKTGEVNEPPQGTFVLQDDKTLLPGNTLDLIGADVAEGLHLVLRNSKNHVNLQGLNSADPETFLKTLREVNRVMGEKPAGVTDKAGNNLAVPSLIKITSKENPDANREYFVNPADLTSTNIKLDPDSINILKAKVVKNLSLNLFDQLGPVVNPAHKALMEPLRDDLKGCDSCILKEFGKIIKLSAQMLEIVNFTEEKIESIGESQKDAIEKLEGNDEEQAKLINTTNEKIQQLAERQSLCILETFLGGCLSNEKNKAMLKKIKKLSSDLGYENSCLNLQELAKEKKELDEEKKKKVAEEAAKNPKPVIVSDTTTAQATPAIQPQHPTGPYNYAPPYYPPTTQNNHQNDMAMPMMMMMMMGGGFGGGQNMGFGMGSFPMMPFPFMGYGFGGGGGIYY